ncbi:hypothetical protein RhiJN_05122 [Ceratobasidium sp. AG-Ba]|nr:hypothetical protein RhiJN_05122 [Ceratobasidium sp. AG-Ba]QRW06048.1 hypothetical protein RhiLY_05047 [Ceratobasidium sp. AG-Ba]
MRLTASPRVMFLRMRLAGAVPVPMNVYTKRFNHDEANVSCNIPTSQDYDHSSKGTTGTTVFTRRPIVNDLALQCDASKSDLAKLNEWHTQTHNAPVGWEFSNAGSMVHPIWEAVPTILGERHEQYKGVGHTKQVARQVSAGHILKSGHVYGKIFEGRSNLLADMFSN